MCVCIEEIGQQNLKTCSALLQLRYIFLFSQIVFACLICPNNKTKLQRKNFEHAKKLNRASDFSIFLFSSTFSSLAAKLRPTANSQSSFYLKISEHTKIQRELQTNWQAANIESKFKFHSPPAASYNSYTSLLTLSSCLQFFLLSHCDFWALL